MEKQAAEQKTECKKQAVLLLLPLQLLLMAGFQQQVLTG